MQKYYPVKKNILVVGNGNQQRLVAMGNQKHHNFTSLRHRSSPT